MGITEYFASLSDNPYFGAGFGLFGLGVGTAILRKGLQVGSIIFRRQCMMTLEVPCRDRSYQWVLQWIAKNASKAQHLSVETKFAELDGGKITTHYNFMPSVGTHIFRYGGTWIRVERNREQSTIDLQMGIPFETVTLTTLSIGTDKKLFETILKNAKDMAIREQEGKTLVYSAFGSEWRQFGHPRAPRPRDSVVLDEGISDRIVKDVKEFIANSKWYTERGIPYRRGYLLHGPPGCGKSSFITALAGELKYGICILNIAERGLSDDRLNHLMNAAPVDSIILLEDVDACFGNREESEQRKAAFEGLNMLTFSGLLNCLDGVASSEGRILFMTTNYKDRLDPALVRPGRVDMTEEIGYCTPYQLQTMFIQFYTIKPKIEDSTKNGEIKTEDDAKSEPAAAPRYSNEDLPDFAKQFVEKALDCNKEISAATVQGILLQNKNDPESAIQNLPNAFSPNSK